MDEIKLKLGCSTLSRRSGIYTARWSFFYRNGGTSEGHANLVKRHFPDAEIVEHREIWKPFLGGAPVANQSHWLVRFKL